MTLIDRTGIFKRCILTMFCVAFACQLARGGTLTAASLRTDIKYYKHVAAQKSLNTNDRYYILLRINDKYQGSAVDLAPLHKEMKALEASRWGKGPVTGPTAVGIPAKAVSSATPPAPAADAVAAPAVPPQTPVDTAVIVSSVPVEQPPVPSQPAAKLSPETYLIDTGDLLAISVFPADELSRDTIVQPDGNISFPLVGALMAKGFTPKQLEKAMETNLGRFISSPQVGVTIKQFNRRQVFITGEVHTVGPYNFKENTRLLEFISAAGGFTDDANRKEVKVYRGPATKRQVFKINVEDIIRSGDFSKDFLLETGDIVEVSKGQARVSILGDVRVPGYYDYRANLRLMDLVSMAGGFTESAQIGNVSIIHPDDQRTQHVTKVSLKKILAGDQRDILVASGDTVYIPRKALASSNWFINTILPWISLISLIVVIRGGI